MINVDPAFVGTYVDAVAASINAFLPLIGATIGIFLAFAIANMLRFFIQKTATKVR